MIGTKGTLHVGRFCGYPGPIPVEVWTDRGELHERSATFEMTTFDGGYAEFQPRFHRAYQSAHRAFREAVGAAEPFAVTQSEVLDAQVLVEAAHRSALADAAALPMARSDDIFEYRRLCDRHGLMD